MEAFVCSVNPEAHRGLIFINMSKIMKNKKHKCILIHANLHLPLAVTVVILLLLSLCDYYPKSNISGNKYKLLNHTFHYDLRKQSFSTLRDNTENSPSNSVVDVDTVCLFKACLNKVWMHQLVKYEARYTSSRCSKLPTLG